jgi:hypothetical protein
LRYKGRLWLGDDTQLHTRVLSTLYNSPIGGHSGIPITCSRVKKLFAWNGLKSFVRNYVHGCQVYLQAKSDQAAYPGKLQPLLVPTEAWDTITMDFIDGLPHCSNANCILVVVDKFTRYIHFIPLSHPYTTSSMAHFFMSHIYKLHGLSSGIISDQDPVFTSLFWKHLF